MSYTEKHTTISLSKEDVRLLEAVKDIINESASNVFRRALSHYYAHLKLELKDKNK